MLLGDVLNFAQSRPPARSATTRRSSQNSWMSSITWKNAVYLQHSAMNIPTAASMNSARWSRQPSRSCPRSIAASASCTMRCTRISRRMRRKSGKNFQMHSCQAAGGRPGYVLLLAEASRKVEYRYNAGARGAGQRIHKRLRRNQLPDINPAETVADPEPGKRTEGIASVSGKLVYTVRLTHGSRQDIETPFRVDLRRDAVCLRF